MMDWRELWTILTGLEPPIYHVSAAVSSLLLFAIIFTLCFTMHRLSEIVIPKFLRIYCLDFFKTLAFCSYPFGLMILRKYHGDLGYALCNIPLNTATALLLSAGEGSPVGNWLLFVKGRQSMTKCVLRIFVQLCAGLSGFRLGKLLMNLDFHPEFNENLSQTACVTALNVSASLGMIIELLGTIWDVWFHSQNFSNNVVVDKLLKFCNSSLTFCLGGYPTGMFRDPAKAVGLTYGCSGVTPSEHILVYWIGPMIGSYIAHKITLQSGDLQNKRTNKTTPQMDSDKAKNRKRRA